MFLAYVLLLVLLLIPGSTLAQSVGIIGIDTPVNYTPVADPQEVTTTENTAIRIVLSGEDANGDPVTFAIVGTPANGRLSDFDAGTGAVIYSPGSDFSGSDSFTFKLNDGIVDSDPATVTIFVVASAVINDLVSFAPINSTINTTNNTSGCPAGFVGKFSFNARLTNKGTSPSLSNLLIKVNTLTNGNLLQNADGGPAGVGATLTVRKVGSLSDGVLGPGESVDIPFVLCLKTMARFSFFVDVLGVVGQNNIAGR